MRLGESNGNLHRATFRYLCANTHIVYVHHFGYSMRIKQSIARVNGYSQAEENSLQLYLYILWEEVLVNDTSLLKIEHDVSQLVGVFQNLVWSQAIL